MAATVEVGGDMFPAIGMGTFGSDRYGAAEVAAAVTPLLSFVPKALRFGSTSIHAAVPAMRPPHCSVFRLIARDKRHELAPLLRV